jgi:hypothetical protein
VNKPLGVCFTPFLIVEEHPLVLSSDPPELPQIWWCCSHEQYSAATGSSPYPSIPGRLWLLLQVITHYCHHNPLALYQKRSFLLHSSIPLQSACAFSHLYPTPLHIVVGLVITTSAEAHFTLLVPGFYSRSWI